MQGTIEKIDGATEVVTVLNLMAEAMKEWIDDKITQKQYSYLKGYSDCKIKHLRIKK